MALRTKIALPGGFRVETPTNQIAKFNCILWSTCTAVLTTYGGYRFIKWAFGQYGTKSSTTSATTVDACAAKEGEKSIYDILGVPKDDESDSKSIEVMREWGNLSTIHPIMGKMLHKEDLAIVFGGPGSGKSLAMLELAINLADGQDCTFMPTGVEQQAQKVIYYNYELTERDLSYRYPEREFPANLDFVPMKQTKSIELCKRIREDVDSLIQNREDGTIFIDTITSAFPGFFQKEANEVLSAFHSLIQKTKAENGISLTIILVGHTYKQDPWEPITEARLAGTGMLGRLVDAQVGMGKTNREGTILLKSLKSRVSQSHNRVHLVNIKKTDEYKDFELSYGGTADEAVALPKRPKPTQESLPDLEEEKRTEEFLKAEINRLLAEGKSKTDIANELGIDRKKVYEIIKGVPYKH